MTDTALATNNIAKIARSRLVRAGQIIQSIGSRGRATDIDSHIFRRPILAGFATGFTKLSEMMMESRSAAMSLYFTKDPMKKSEYFNRNIQLSSATLSNLHRTDCGSRNYLPITISSKQLLKDMSGIRYCDEATQKEIVIGKHSHHLLNKVIGIRSVLTCQHPDRYGVCTHCFGELGLSIPRNTNIGHVSASEMQSKIGQLLLSNKHYVASAVADSLLLGDYELQFLQPSTKGDNYIYLHPNLQGSEVKVIVKESEAANLSLIHSVANVQTLVPYRISEITHLTVVTTIPGGTAEHPVAVTNGVRTASLTSQMLKYLQKKKWEVNDNGDYVFDVSDWDTTKPFLVLPRKHFSTLDFMLQIEAFIKGAAGKGRKSIMKYETPSAALMAFHDLVSLKLDVHFSYLQTIILSMLVQSRQDRDYRLPMPREAGTPAHYKQLMDYRSSAAKMAFQGQTSAIFSPGSFLVKVRPPHPLDQMLLG